MGSAPPLRTCMRVVGPASKRYRPFRRKELKAQPPALKAFAVPKKRSSSGFRFDIKSLLAAASPNSGIAKDYRVCKRTYFESNDAKALSPVKAVTERKKRYRRVLVGTRRPAQNGGRWCRNASR